MLIHRAYQTFHRVRLVWWWLRRPTNHGAMVALWCGPSVLLVHTSYRAGWTLPGGFVKSGETLGEAAARELMEETGIPLEAASLQEAQVIFHTTEHLQDHVHVFEARCASRPAIRIDNREVVEAAFVDERGALDLPLFPPVREYLSRRLTLTGRNGSRSL